MADLEALLSLGERGRWSASRHARSRRSSAAGRADRAHASSQSQAQRRHLRFLRPRARTGEEGRGQGTARPMAGFARWKACRWRSRDFHAVKGEIHHPRLEDLRGLPPRLHGADGGSAAARRRHHAPAHTRRPSSPIPARPTARSGESRAIRGTWSTPPAAPPAARARRVAAGMTTLADGTDGGGSIRIPASACGLFGYKPPFGRNPLDRDHPLETILHYGPMVRSVADAALMQNVMSGPHPEDHRSLPGRVRLPATYDSIRGCRVALSMDLGYLQVDPEVEEHTRRAAALFRELGCEVEEVDLGWDFRRPRRLRDLVGGHLRGPRRPVPAALAIRDGPLRRAAGGARAAAQRRPPLPVLWRPRVGCGSSCSRSSSPTTS